MSIAALSLASVFLLWAWPGSAANFLSFNSGPFYGIVGTVGLPTQGSVLQVLFDGPVAFDTFVAITSSDPTILTVASGGVTIPTGSTSALVVVDSLSLGYVTLTASYGGTVASTGVSVVSQIPITRYVDLNNPAPAAPYTSWATAATNIQDALDAAASGDAIMVTNGVYQDGARAVYGMSNRVAITKPVRVQSVNGPGATTIVGYQAAGTTNGVAAVRCVYLTNGAVLTGFTLTNGATQSTGNPATNQSGGGVWCESASAVVSNCMLTGNSAAFGQGGGAAGGTLVDCTLTGNSAWGGGGGAASSALSNCTLTLNVASASYYGAPGFGGGAYESTLNKCTLTGNFADYGGGAEGGTLFDCKLTGNVATYTGGGADAATLNNCALSGNSIHGNGAGAGVAYSTLSNCTLAGNSVPGEGGGAYYGVLNNCTLTGNSATVSGGGAAFAVLNNCTLTGNSTFTGGGAYGGTLYNSVVYKNTGVLSGDNYDTVAVLNYCCTTPLPTNGVGNITNPPAFLDQAGGNLRLQTNSPCINAGNNAYSPGATDLDGNPRISGGTADIGAYEFPTPASIISYAWLQQYDLPTDGSVDFADPDSDGMNNWQEWRAGTSPRDAASALRILKVVAVTNGLTVIWQSVSGISYSLERSADLAAPPGFSVLYTNLPSQGVTTACTDTNAPGPGPWFYRVGVGQW